MEVLLDVMAFAGFIGLASLHRGARQRREPPQDSSAH
jgi:hypothetical protein